MLLHSRHVSPIVPAGVALLSGLLLLLPTVLEAADARPLEAPDWSPGDWWVLEQSKRQLATATEGWSEPLRWRCEVKTAPDAADHLILEIRRQSSGNAQASALERLVASSSHSAAPKLGVDVVFSVEPWQVYQVSTHIATASGVKTIDHDLVGSGPLLMLTGPFDLALPSFPLQSVELSTLQSRPSAASVGSAAGPAQIQDSSGGGPVLGHQVMTAQQVRASRAADPMTARAKAAAASLPATRSLTVVDSGRLVDIRSGRQAARQVWVQGLPWALTEETPYSKTSLVELP